MPRSRRTRPTSCRGSGAAAARLQGGPADEVGLAGVPVEVHEAAQASLQGRGLAVQLVAVQRHARLEAQRVARAQAAGQQAMATALRQERVPDGRSVIPGDEELETVLTGVAGAGHHRGDAPRTSAAAQA